MNEDDTLQAMCRTYILLIFFVIGHYRRKIGFFKCFDVHPSLLGQIYTDNETDTVITILFEQKKALKHDFDS